MDASFKSNELLIQGAGDILESQQQRVRDNLQRLKTVRDSLYTLIGPIMPKVIGFLGSGSDKYLKYIAQESKRDKKYLYNGFRISQRERIDDSLSTVKEFIDKVLVQPATIDIICEDTKKISDLQLQLLSNIPQALAENFDGGRSSKSIVDDPFQPIPVVASTNSDDTLVNVPSTSSLLPLTSPLFPAVSPNAERINLPKSKSTRKPGVNKTPTNINAKSKMSFETTYNILEKIVNELPNRGCELTQTIVTLRLRNSLTYTNLWEGNIDNLGYHVFEYIKQVGLGKNQAFLRDHRKRIIACVDDGKPSFEDFFSSHEFVSVQSKHSKVNMFVTKLVNNANVKF